jgi:hypothetical protein
MTEEQRCLTCSSEKIRYSSGRLRCRICERRYDRLSYVRNREQRLIKRKKEYDKADKSRLLELKRNWYKRQHYLRNTWVGINNRCYNPSNESYNFYGGRGIDVHEPWIMKRGKTHDIRDQNIVILDRFVSWVEENLGDRPAACSLDRINNSGNYEPGNLRWATAEQQANNTRRNVKYKKSISEYQLIDTPTGTCAILSLAEKTGIFTKVLTSRAARFSDYNYLVNDPKILSRKHLYKNNLYSTDEICYINGCSYDVVRSRFRYGWTVEEVIETNLMPRGNNTNWRNTNASI